MSKLSPPSFLSFLLFHYFPQRICNSPVISTLKLHAVKLEWTTNKRPFKIKSAFSVPSMSANEIINVLCCAVQGWHDLFITINYQISPKRENSEPWRKLRRSDGSTS